MRVATNKLKQGSQEYWKEKTMCEDVFSSYHYHAYFVRWRVKMELDSQLEKLGQKQYRKSLDFSAEIPHSFKTQ